MPRLGNIGISKTRPLGNIMGSLPEAQTKAELPPAEKHNNSVPAAPRSGQSQTSDTKAGSDLEYHAWQEIQSANDVRSYRQYWTGNAYEDSKGVLVPVGYGADKLGGWHCPDRECWAGGHWAGRQSSPFATLELVGTHFGTEHTNTAYYDNGDGTLSRLGRCFGEPIVVGKSPTALGYMTSPAPQNSFAPPPAPPSAPAPKEDRPPATRSYGTVRERPPFVVIESRRDWAVEHTHLPPPTVALHQAKQTASSSPGDPAAPPAAAPVPTEGRRPAQLTEESHREIPYMEDLFSSFSGCISRLADHFDHEMRPGGELHYFTVSRFLFKLEQRWSSPEGLCCFSPHFWPHWLGRKAGDIYNPCPADSDVYLVIPVREFGHWFAIVVYQAPAGTVYVTFFDSLDNDHDNCIPELKAYLSAVQFCLPRKNIAFLYPRGLPRQTTEADSGVFLLAYLEKFFDDPRNTIQRIVNDEALQWTIDPAAFRNQIALDATRVVAERCTRELRMAVESIAEGSASGAAFRDHFLSLLRAPDPAGELGTESRANDHPRETSPPDTARHVKVEPAMPQHAEPEPAGTGHPKPVT